MLEHSVPSVLLIYITIVNYCFEQINDDDEMSSKQEDSWLEYTDIRYSYFQRQKIAIMVL